MSRESFEELMARKKALYQKHHELLIAEIDAELEHAYSPAEKELAAQEKLQEVQAQKLESQLQLNRAQLFGLRFAKAPLPSVCMSCFINHGSHFSMVEIESMSGNGFRLFKCAECGAQLQVAPVP